MINLTKLEEKSVAYELNSDKRNLSDEDLFKQMKRVEKDMKKAAELMEFEEAALWRDKLSELKQEWNERHGVRAGDVMKRYESVKKRIKRPVKKRI